MHRSSNRRRHIPSNAFLQCAEDAIARHGGSLFYTDREIALNGIGAPIVVLNPDKRTTGRIGWPTIQSLTAMGKLVHVEGNKFSLKGYAT